MQNTKGYNILMPLAMIALVVIAAFSVLNFVVTNMTDAPDVRVTVEQPVPDDHYRARFPNYVPPKN